MSKEGMTQLSEEMYQYLQDMRFLVLTTIKDEKSPFVNAISWTYAKSNEMIRFAVDSKSQIIKNIIQNNEVALTLFFNESVYSIYGEAKLLTDHIEGIPFKLAMVEVHVNNIYDVMFYGSKISSQPKYEKTYNPEAAEKLDKQVLEALKA